MPSSKLLSDSLAEFIDGHVETVQAGSDPLYSDSAVQQLSHLTRSAETRSGLIIQRAIVEGLRRGPQYTVLAPRSFPVTLESKRELDVHEIAFCLSGVHLPVSVQIGVTEIDLILIRHRDRSAGIYEIRRANGRLGYRASKATLLKLAGAQMLARAWIQREYGIVVDRTTSHLLLYFGNREDADATFPPEMLLTRDDIDAHFGMSLREIVDAANEHYGRRIDEAIAKVLRPAKEEP